MAPEHDHTDDESEMTSIMSAEERSLLQEAARGGAGVRDTAKPPRSEADPVVIPKAAAVPGASASAHAAPAGDGGIPLAQVVPFLLLIVASLYAMSH